MEDKDRLKTSQTKQSSHSEAYFWDSNRLLSLMLQLKESLATKTNSTSKVRSLQTYHQAKWVLPSAKPWVAPKRSKWFQNKQWLALRKWTDRIKEWHLLSKTSKWIKFLNSWWTLLLHSWARNRCQHILLMANQTSLITKWKTSACVPRKTFWILILKR